VIASKAYLLAVQYLISHENHWLPIGKYWCCFWAKSNDTVSSLFARILKKPDPKTVKNFFRSPYWGLPYPPPSDEKFFTFSFTASGPRIVIKTWSEATLANVASCFKRWFEDLSIIAPFMEDDGRTPLGIRELVNTTLPLKFESGRFIADVEKMHPDVPAQIYRAALENSKPPPLIIKSILIQLKSRLLRDENYTLIHDQSRFALLKLIVNRNRKETDMEIKSSLAADTHDPAYNCGRLLSVLSETQKKAQGYPKRFSGVAERYFGTASVSPATVLPLLLRLNRHHLDKIRKSGGNAFEEVVIRNIVAKFKPAGEAMPPVFPRTLDLQAQGRFALGFYQQQADDANARIAFKVLIYLEETDATAHLEALALQENDPQAFYEMVSQHYGSDSFKEWMEKKQKKAKASSTADESGLFDNE
jgi:CRISPR-associated protein Csd1